MAHTISVELGTGDAFSIYYLVVERVDGNMVKVCARIPCHDNDYMTAWNIALGYSESYGADFDTLLMTR